MQASEPDDPHSPLSLTHLVTLYDKITATPLEQCTPLELKVVHQIDLDKGRSGMAIDEGSAALEGERPKQQVSLRRVLLAVALYDVGVAYVQGLNFIAAFALESLDWQEGCAFALMIRLLYATPKYGLGSLYLGDLGGVKSLSNAIDALLAQASPSLSAHFHACSISSVLVFEWPFTLFTRTLPPTQCAQLWDALFEQGFSPLLHATTIALLLHLEPVVIGMNTHGTLMALKGCARAMEGGEGTGLGEANLRGAIDPPADLIEKAQGLVAKYGWTRNGILALSLAPQAAAPRQ